MSNEETQKILDSMCNVMPENLKGEAKKIFEAIMKIADQRDEFKKTCYAMAEYIANLDIDEDICKHIKCSEVDKEREECIECVINYFKNK